MNQSYPVPPPELVQKCWDELRDQTQVLDAAKAWDKAIALAYTAGADQELEATLELMATLNIRGVDYVRNARRSARAPSLKEQAIKGFHTMSQFVLDEWSGCSDYKVYKEITDTVLRALEQLND